MYKQAFGSIPGIGVPCVPVPGKRAYAIHSKSSLLVLSKSGVKLITIVELLFLFTLHGSTPSLHPSTATESIVQLAAKCFFFFDDNKVSIQMHEVKQTWIEFADNSVTSHVDEFDERASRKFKTVDDTKTYSGQTPPRCSERKRLVSLAARLQIGLHRVRRQK